MVNENTQYCRDKLLMLLCNASSAWQGIFPGRAAIPRAGL
jgi:hypothetical protein